MKMEVNKLKVIAELLNGKQGYFSVELYGPTNKWYVECWTDGKLNPIYNGYTEDLDVTLDEIIRKLQGGE
jgi:hypothetical protein